MTATETLAKRYTAIAIALHWVLGALLTVQFVFGNYMADLPFSPRQLKLFNYHKWAGIVLLVLSLARLLWRLSHPPPQLSQSIANAMPRWQSLAHKTNIITVYALFFIVPLTGWAYSSAAGFQIVVFGLLPLPDWVPADKALAELIKPWHQATAWTMAALVCLHVAAAFKHQFVDKDGLMSRILPRLRQ